MNAQATIKRAVRASHVLIALGAGMGVALFHAAHLSISCTTSWSWWSLGNGLVSFIACLATLSWLQTRRKARVLEHTVSGLGVYQLDGKIASGGMGTVFKAHHALLKRPTAIKIARDSEQAAYFAKEVLVTSRLTHPNTVMVYDYGQGQDDSFYCAMEYIEGFDLQRLVELHGPVPDGRTVRFLLQIAGSLKEAHDCGLVHRDVKPSNIMITERGGMKDFIKVLDFGLVKRQPHLPRTETFPSLGPFIVAGTPGYVAPEVIAGSAATAASDIFALGAVAYYLLTGTAPFGSDSAIKALTNALSRPVPPLPAHVSADVSRLVTACLERNPENRPRGMNLLSQELRRALPSCTTWSTDDAEAWWQSHPPDRQLERLDSSLTFLLRQQTNPSRPKDAVA